MEMFDYISLGCAAGIFVYMAYALLCPEKF